MKRMMYSLLVFLTLVASGGAGTGAYAEVPLAIDLAEDKVNITTGFTGTSLVVFGDKKAAGEIILTLQGPQREIVVRRKSRVFGAWINRGWLTFEDMPSYYDYAVSGEEDEASLLSQEALRTSRIGLASLKVAPRKDWFKGEELRTFQASLLRNKQGQHLYPTQPEKVVFISESLFRADFKLPSNVPSGEYVLSAYLVRNNKIIDQQNKRFRVGLLGFSSDIYEFSIDHSFFYGVLVVFFACIAGWISNTIVRRN